MPEDFAHSLPFGVFFGFNEGPFTELSQEYPGRQNRNIDHLQHFGQGFLILLRRVLHLEDNDFLNPLGNGLPELFNGINKNETVHVLVEHGNKVVQVVHVLQCDIDFGNASEVNLVIGMNIGQLDLLAFRGGELCLGLKVLERTVGEDTLKQLWGDA